jgi:hypothetical protein
MPLTHDFPLGQLHVIVLPQLSVTDGHALPQVPFAAWQVVPLLQHCPEPQPLHVTGVADSSGLTPACPPQSAWCTSPEQSVPHAAGFVQHCAPTTAVPLAFFGVTSPLGQAHVMFLQPSKITPPYVPLGGHATVGVQQSCVVVLHSMPLPQPAVHAAVLPEHVDGAELPEHWPAGQVGFAQHIEPSVLLVGSSGSEGKRLQSQTCVGRPQPGLNAG